MRLHIAHANGFPSAVYEPLAKRLDADVFSIPMIGHDAFYPVKAEWDSLVEQLIAYLIEKSQAEKVFLVGHSLGALLSFKVAHARPDLVSGLVMLDPPLIYGASAWPMRIARKLGKIDDVTPARLSKYRKRHWNSWEAVEIYFQKKAFFTQLHPDVYAQWLQNGVIKSDDGYRLAFDVDTEVEIFRTTPLYLSQMKGRLRVPSWLFYAKDSDATFKRCVEPFSKKFGLRLSTTNGGHMFPLKHLDDTAVIINRCLGEIAV